MHSDHTTPMTPPQAPPPSRLGSLIPLAIVAIGLLAVLLLARWVVNPTWEYGQFYLFVWNDRASAGWFGGDESGTVVEQTVFDDARPHRLVLGEVARELGCRSQGTDDTMSIEDWRLADFLTDCLGTDGWELTGVTETLHDGALSPEILVGRTYLFKRRAR